MQNMKVKEQFCEEHQADLDTLLNMVDDLVATAVACGSSPQNYFELQRAKAEFVDTTMNISLKYRIVDTT